MYKIKSTKFWWLLLSVLIGVIYCFIEHVQFSDFSDFLFKFAVLFVTGNVISKFSPIAKKKNVKLNWTDEK